MAGPERGPRQTPSPGELSTAFAEPSDQHAATAAAATLATTIAALPSANRAHARLLHMLRTSLSGLSTMHESHPAAHNQLALAAAAAQEDEQAPSSPHPLPPSSRMLFPQPAPCAFLRPGQAFQGKQRVAHHLGPVPKPEHWEVSAVIQHYDPSAGYIAGTMEANNVPDMLAPVITFFEGEIIDNLNHSFYTSDWDACAETDFQHWGKCPSFRDLHAEVARYGGRCPGLASHPYIYMRWKEQFFVRGGECRLTIAGFYYLALHRVTGKVLGFYWDPASSPDQKLELTALRAAPAGFSFPHYELV